MLLDSHFGHRRGCRPAAHIGDEAGGHAFCVVKATVGIYPFNPDRIKAVLHATATSFKSQNRPRSKAVMEDMSSTPLTLLSW